MKSEHNSMLIKEKLKDKIKLLKVELIQSNNKFKTLFNKSLDIILIIRDDGKILEVNKTASYILGYKKTNLIGKDFATLFPNEIMNLETIETNDAVFQYQEILRSDGSVCPMDMTLNSIKWKKKNAILATLRDSTERKKAEEEKKKLINELKEALVNIKTLKSLLPICSSCKNIRDDKGYWNQVEEYIYKHAGVEFTHGICPACMKKLYPEYIDIIEKDKINKELK